MKKILFVRHAKSSWADIKLDDKQRPLNKRGKRDAPLMAARCVEYGLKVQLLISSPAVRAFATCLVFQDIYNLHTPIQVENHLFHGDVFRPPDWISLRPSVLSVDRVEKCRYGAQPLCDLRSCSNLAYDHRPSGRGPQAHSPR